jgi:putative DNA primase/helicase
MQACCLPGWAALCARGIERLVLPPSVHKVIICADNDSSGVGQRAAARAEQRWLREGRLVRIATPPKSDSDWNDVLMGSAPARIVERGRAYA